MSYSPEQVAAARAALAAKQPPKQYSPEQVAAAREALAQQQQQAEPEGVSAQTVGNPNVDMDLMQRRQAMREEFGGRRTSGAHLERRINAAHPLNNRDEELYELGESSATNRALEGGASQIKRSAHNVANKVDNFISDRFGDDVKGGGIIDDEKFAQRDARHEEVMDNTGFAGQVGAFAGDTLLTAPIGGAISGGARVAGNLAMRAPGMAKAVAQASQVAKRGTDALEKTAAARAATEAAAKIKASGVVQQAKKIRTDAKEHISRAGERINNTVLGLSDDGGRAIARREGVEQVNSEAKKSLLIRTRAARQEERIRNEEFVRDREGKVAATIARKNDEIAELSDPAKQASEFKRQMDKIPGKQAKVMEDHAAIQAELAHLKKTKEVAKENWNKVEDKFQRGEATQAQREEAREAVHGKGRAVERYNKLKATSDGFIKKNKDLGQQFKDMEGGMEEATHNIEKIQKVQKSRKTTVRRNNKAMGLEKSRNAAARKKIAASTAKDRSKTIAKADKKTEALEAAEQRERIALANKIERETAADRTIIANANETSRGRARAAVKKGRAERNRNAAKMKKQYDAEDVATRQQLQLETDALPALPKAGRAQKTAARALRSNTLGSAGSAAATSGILAEEGETFDDALWGGIAGGVLGGGRDFAKTAGSKAQRAGPNLLLGAAIGGGAATGNIPMAAGAYYGSKLWRKKASTIEKKLRKHYSNKSTGPLKQSIRAIRDVAIAGGVGE